MPDPYTLDSCVPECACDTDRYPCPVGRTHRVPDSYLDADPEAIADHLAHTTPADALSCPHCNPPTDPGPARADVGLQRDQPSD